MKLRLDWNSIKDQGAFLLFKSIGKSFSLKYFDIAWNSLGNISFLPASFVSEPSKDSDPQTLMAKAIARCFEKNSSLFHVDLSHNNLNAKTLKIISQGLQNNHNIYGIHIEGN